MRKILVIEFLETKRRQAVEAIEEGFDKQIEDRKRDLHGGIGLMSTSERIQKLVSDSHDLMGDLMVRADNAGHKIQGYGLYQSLSNMCYEQGRIQNLIKRDTVLHDDVLKSMGAEKRAKASYVSGEYTKVTNVVRSMPNGKKALEYIKELGFDTAELEKKSAQPVTALAVKIDTKALIFK